MVKPTLCIPDGMSQTYPELSLQAEAEAARQAEAVAHHSAIRDQRLRDIEEDRRRAAGALAGAVSNCQHAVSAYHIHTPSNLPGFGITQFRRTAALLLLCKSTQPSWSPIG